MSRTQAILEYLQSGKPKTLKQIANKFAITESTAARYLRDGTIRDKVSKDTSKPLTRYMATGKVAAIKEKKVTVKKAATSKPKAQPTVHSLPEGDFVMFIQDSPKSTLDMATRFNIPVADVDASVKAHPVASDVHRLVSRNGTVHYVLFSSIKDNAVSLDYKGSMFKRKTSTAKKWDELTEKYVKSRRWTYLK